MNIKGIIKKIILGEKADSTSYINHLKKCGVKIGHDVTIYSPTHTLIDVTTPHLLSIGNHVRITHGVIILTHDYSWSVLKNYDSSKGAVIGAQSKVSIGNNVFIGMNTIITRGVTIHDNVIIGAGSVVTKDCEPNSVYAGNPAKKIMTLDQFLEKRKQKQLEEAKNVAVEYFNRYGKIPEKEIFNEYFMLFETAESASAIPQFLSQMKTSNNYDDTVAYMNSHCAPFSSFEEFISECGLTK